MRMNKCVVALFGAMVALSCCLLQAAEPVAVVAVRSAADVLAAGGKIMSKIDEPAGALAIAGAQLAIGENGPFGGFDVKKPVALVILDDKTGFLALPVKDLEKVKANFYKPNDGDTLKAVDGEEGLYECVSASREGVTNYVRVIDNWLFISEQKNAIPKQICPALAQKVKALCDDYLISVYFTTQTVDVQERLAAVDKVRDEIRKNTEVNCDKPIPEFAKKILDRWGDKLYAAAKQYAADAPDFTFGLKVDAEKGLFFETSFGAQKGTKSAKALASLQNVETKLAGFYQPEAAWAFRLSGKAKLLTEQQLDDVLNEIGKALYAKVDEHISNAEENQWAKEKLIDVKNLVARTINSRNIDCAMSAYLSADKGISFVGARYCADPAEAQKLAAEWFEQFKKVCPDKAGQLEKGIKGNVDTINGVQIHTITIPVPESCPQVEKARKLVGGNELQIAVGFGNNMIASAIGGNALENLKTALKNSIESRKVMIYEYTVRPLEFLKTAEEFCPAIQKYQDELNEFKTAMGKTYKKCGLERVEIGGRDGKLVIVYNLSYSGLKGKLKFFPIVEKLKDK